MFRWLFSIVIICFIILFFGRAWYDALVLEAKYNQTVHQDKSEIKTGFHPQVRPKIQLTYQNQSGELVKVLADAQHYSEFIQQSVKTLEKVRKNLIKQADNELEHALKSTFEPVHDRVDQFADWYFAYTTTYKILWKAVTATAEYTISLSAKDLSDAVAYDVEQYILKHYEEIVLRPELTHPSLKRAYQNTLTSIHNQYINALSIIHLNFLSFVSTKTTHLESENTQVAITLDWHSQFNKIHMAAYEKTPEGKTLGAILIAGGASIGGKAFGGIAAKTAVSTASKGLLSKLASPFVTKAIVIGGSGAVGTLGGPIGAVIGASIGLGVDYTINEGVEVMHREAFVKDVNEAIIATQNEWKIPMSQSIHKAIDILIDDAIQLLPSYEKH
ncbi:hypothetical protein [Candidatus Albibeggiatoa sp. nov. NOAA]|uniref:hypothetical protein n=1 Tax=Candidatus Albibeggiatoa sp. nov. NOAA TaxID=3162724 RepID=UPI0032FF9D67|nr:hypothetical protein [Thiotrichaceae bacterium]